MESEEVRQLLQTAKAEGGHGGAGVHLRRAVTELERVVLRVCSIATEGALETRTSPASQEKPAQEGLTRLQWRKRLELMQLIAGPVGQMGVGTTGYDELTRWLMQADAKDTVDTELGGLRPRLRPMRCS